MKTKLAILAMMVGILLIVVEFFYEIHIALKVIGVFVGLTMFIEGILDVRKIQHGYILRWKSFWVGLHYSDFNKRYCLNLLPGVTLWWTGEGGKAPNRIL